MLLFGSFWKISEGIFNLSHPQKPPNKINNYCNNFKDFNLTWIFFWSVPFFVHGAKLKTPENFLPLPKNHLIYHRYFKIYRSKKVEMIFSNRCFFQKSNKQIHFTAMKLQVNMFLSIFWRKLKTPKRHFEIIWPLSHL